MFKLTSFVTGMLLSVALMTGEARAVTVLTNGAGGTPGTGFYNATNPGFSIGGQGQTIIAPTEQPLESFSLALQVGIGGTYEGHVFTLNGTKFPNEIWSSGALAGTGASSITVDVPSLALTSGETYLIAITFTPGANFEMRAGDTYAGGELWFYSQPGYGGWVNAATAQPFGGNSGYDALFTATFGTENPVPEPASMALMGAGAAALACRRHARRA